MFPPTCSPTTVYPPIHPSLLGLLKQHDSSLPTEAALSHFMPFLLLDDQKLWEDIYYLLISCIVDYDNSHKARAPSKYFLTPISLSCRTLAGSRTWVWSHRISRVRSNALCVVPRTLSCRTRSPREFFTCLSILWASRTGLYELQFVLLQRHLDLFWLE